MLKQALRALLAAVLLTSSAMAMALDSASILVGGWTASKVLDKADAIINDILGTAAQNSSLVISKGARDAQLLVAATRQELHDELDTQWDQLGQQKISILRELDSSIGGLNQIGITAVHLEDAAVLDIGSIIERLPFTKSTPTIRRIDGGSQYYRKDGLYRVIFTTNLVSLAPVQSITMTVGGKSLPTGSINISPPYTISALIPASFLKFDQTKLSFAPVEIRGTVSTNRGLKVWEDSDRPVVLSAKIEMFPIKAVTYTLIEWRSVPTVARDRLEIQKGDIINVKGCGDSGCNAYVPHCVGVPAGAVPVDFINATDSLVGWGGWGPPRVEGTQVCATYWQHSHNVDRNVGFDARYYPVDQVRTAVPVVLQKIGVVPVNPGAGPPPGFFTGGVVDTSAELGATYNALFSSQYVSYDLAVKTFTGETIVATPAMAPPGNSVVKVSALESNGPFKRTTVSFKLPW